VPPKTRRAAALLNTTESHLHYLIRSRKIPPPARDDSGDYCWADADLERARAAMKMDRRRREHRRAAPAVA
jgi:hypothetical protein